MSFRQKIQSRRRKSIDEHAGFEALGAVHLIRRDDEAIPWMQHLCDAVDFHLKNAAFHTGYLLMRVRMAGGDGAAVEVYAHQHQMGIVGHDLTSDARGGLFNRHAVVKNMCFHFDLSSTRLMMPPRA